MKKIISLILALMLVLCMGAAAFAEDVSTGGEETPTETTTNKNPTFTKTYQLENADTTNPAETFTFTFTADRVEETTTVTKNNMPPISNVTVVFNAGEATTTGLEKEITVDLKDVNWPNVGVYYYKVQEVAGKTAGVIYDNNPAYLKVTVAYDQSTHTYYTAFVTLNLTDSDNDGQTDVKTGGFTNKYQAGNLSISKTVAGNMGDKNKYFKFEVTLTGVSGKTYMSSYDVTGGTYTDNPKTVAVNTTDSSTKYTFYLKDNETVTIKNLPYGVSYTVTEDNYTNDGYTTTGGNVTDTDGNTKGNESIGTINSANNAVDFTNTKGTTVDMGVSTDSLPYVVLLGVVALIGAAMIIKRRAAND